MARASDESLADVRSKRRAGFISEAQADERILVILDRWIATLHEIRELPDVNELRRATARPRELRCRPGISAG
jgi:hypothetical protein